MVGGKPSAMPDTALTQLSPHDLQWALKLLPKEVLEVLQLFPGHVFVAGGFIRASISNEKINDIDIFVDSKETAENVANFFMSRRFGYRSPQDFRRIDTDNAFTILGVTKIPLQVIHRWTFTTPAECIASFDFTVAASAIYWVPDLTKADELATKPAGKWTSLTDPNFYADLAAKRLVYRAPDREEEPGGSMLRVLKFYQKGYRIPLTSLALIMARCVAGVDIDKLESSLRLGTGQTWQNLISQDIAGLLREVDPALDPKHIAHLPDVQ